jgi:hypothetical protein
MAANTPFKQINEHGLFKMFGRNGSGKNISGIELIVK